MPDNRFHRRDFLRSTAATTGAIMTPYWFTDTLVRAEGAKSKNDRPQVGVIGVGGRGSALARKAAERGHVVAICDVDLQQAEKMKTELGGKATVYQDYRKLLDRKDIEIVTNGTPDHWHTLINLTACKAGKDIYTEKPLTLTIDEGKILRKVVGETGRIVQVGTQLRCVPHYQLAIELVRNGRIGTLQRVNVTVPYRQPANGGPFASQPAPAHLDWELYQGQAPVHDYCPERTKFNFRWWFEYSGGIVVDWGAHDIDVAHWGMDVGESGPLTVEAVGVFPDTSKPNCYNTACDFKATLTYPGDLTVVFESHKDARAGVMFVGDAGRLFVNRGGVEGKPVEELKAHPLPENRWKVHPGADHMANFFECVKTRQSPIATVAIAHRSITACHLTNIAMRLNRKLAWDAKAEQIVGDEEANAWLSRPQRVPYRIEA
jgi:myo-inositol 2-dehydrogenase / D-chiro-inositol 1-dehydrogenase